MTETIPTIPLALGQIEEAMGLIDGRAFGTEPGYPPHWINPDRLTDAYKALVRARDMLLCLRALAEPKMSADRTNADRNKWRAELMAQEHTLHTAYMASKAGSQEERILELALEEVMGALDAIFREEQAEWGACDDRIMRDVARRYNGSEL